MGIAGHTWTHPTKINSLSHLPSVATIYIKKLIPSRDISWSKKFAIWLNESIWTRIFPYMGFAQEPRDHKIFHFRIHSAKNNTKIFQVLKTKLFAHFRPILLILGKMWIFQKSGSANLSPCGSLTSRTTFRKANDQIPRKMCYGRTDGQSQIHRALSTFFRGVIQVDSCYYIYS